MGIITNWKGLAYKFTHINTVTFLAFRSEFVWSRTPKVKIYENIIRFRFINVGVNLGTLPCQANIFLRPCVNRVLGIFGYNREGVTRMEENTQ